MKGARVIVIFKIKKLIGYYTSEKNVSLQDHLQLFEGSLTNNNNLAPSTGLCFMFQK